MAQRMDVRVGMVVQYDVRPESEKKAEESRPIGFDPNTPSHL